MLEPLHQIIICLRPTTHCKLLIHILNVSLLSLSLSQRLSRDPIEVEEGGAHLVMDFGVNSIWMSRVRAVKNLCGRMKIGYSLLDRDCSARRPG
jgi:hypothetical protein